jgi:glycosyltransferase involved in cell wall biosynthesis
MNVPQPVAVIIACYNQAHFLSEAIESILDQSYRPIQIIVVDDGSTDNTAQVAAGYSGVRLLRQENQGLSAARNAGLRTSQGTYVVFLDADDRLLPEALETGVKSLNAHPECAFVYGHIKLIAADGSALPTPYQSGIKTGHYVELLRHNYIWSPGAVMYRGAIFNSVSGFNSLINASADFDLNIRIARSFPVYCHNKVILEYRRHDANMSRDLALMLRTSINVRRSQWKHVRGNKQYEEALAGGIRGIQGDYGEKLIKDLRRSLRAREWSKSLRGTIVLLRYYPQGFARHIQRKLSRAFCGRT